MGFNVNSGTRPREALELTVSVVAGAVAGIMLSEEGIYDGQE